MYPLIGAIRFTPVIFTSLFSHAEKILSSFETVKQGKIKCPASHDEGHRINV